MIVELSHERARWLHREAMRAAAADVTDDEPPTSGPFVRAMLTPDALRRLARDERAAFIGLDQEKEIPDYPTIAQSLPTTRTQTVHSNGVRGGGTQDLSQPANDHMTKRIGIIGNRYDAGSCNGPWQGTMSWHFGSEETNGGLQSRDVYFDYWVTQWPYPSVFLCRQRSR